MGAENCPRCDRPWSEHRDTKWRQMENGNWFIGPGAMVYGSILVERRADGTFAWCWSDEAHDYHASMSASYTVAEGEAATLEEAKRAAEAACGEWCPGPAVDWRARALAAKALLHEARTLLQEAWSKRPVLTWEPTDFRPLHVRDALARIDAALKESR